MSLILWRTIRIKLDIKSYAFDDGFLGVGCNRGALWEDPNGRIWIGANERLTVYNPAGNIPDTVPPVVELTGIKFFNEGINLESFGAISDTSLILESGIRIENVKFSGTSKLYGLPEALELPYNCNYITFNFIGITHRQSKKVNYTFQLEGIDANWVAPTLQNYSSYGNLPPGSYLYKVKAMNSEGFWGNEFHFSFKIRPPWWKSWPFRLMFILFIISCIFLIYRWRVSSLLSQRKQLEQTVINKTAEILNKNGELSAINEKLIDSNKELKHQREELETINEELSSAYSELNLRKGELETTLETLKEAQDKLIQSEKMASLGILAAGVAHEINNPLNFIQGGIIGLETYFSENLSEHLDNVSLMLKGIQTGVSRAEAIVTSLTHYSRRDDSPMIESDIHDIIENCLVMVKGIIKCTIEIKKNYTDKGNLILCNESKIHQVILNVLANSIHAINSDGYIEISTSFSGKELVITISDNGCGIGKNDLPKIFDPFFTTKEPGKGTGLGLSISYHILQEHSGTIEIDSKKGKGTKVTIKLPATSR